MPLGLAYGSLSYTTGTRQRKTGAIKLSVKKRTP
jgi:hypothetical protein